MRTVTIDMSVDQQHPICSFGGYAGENKETKLVVILPERMLKDTYTKYRFDFQTILNEQISSTMIDRENLQGGNAVQVILWNQLMPQEGDLKFCVSAFEAAADGGDDVVVQGKTALITLKIGKSVGGAYTPIDVKANADELQTMIQDTIDDTVGIKSAAQPEKSSAPSAGSKAYLITACDQTTKTFTLDSVEGLAVGDVYSITASGYANVEDVGKITAINGKVVTVDHLPVENGVGYGNAVPHSDALPENFPHGLAAPYFRIITKPTVGSQSIGTAALAGGISTEAQMDTSFATGKGSKSVGKYGVAMGKKNTAYYAAASIGGESNKAFGKNSSIVGGSVNQTKAYADFIAGGQHNETSGACAFATGSWNKVPGFNAAAFGLYNESHGQNDFVTGYKNIVNGYCAAAFGLAHSIKGKGNFATGQGNGAKEGAENCFITGQGNLAENASGCILAGLDNAVSGESVDNKILQGVMLGRNNKVTGHYGVAVGYNNVANTQSVALGLYNVADVWRAFALGTGLKAKYTDQVVVGGFNVINGNAAFIVGNGTSDTARSNAFVVNKDGSAEVGKQGTKDLSVATIKDLNEKVSSVYRYKGSVANKEALPTTDNVIGDVYNTEDSGMNYGWNGTTWDTLGSEVDQSYQSTSIKAQSGKAVAEAISGKQDTLVSGTNIKTIKGSSLLGSGDLSVSDYTEYTGTTLDILSENLTKGLYIAKNAITLLNTPVDPPRNTYSIPANSHFVISKNSQYRSIQCLDSPFYPDVAHFGFKDVLCAEFDNGWTVTAFTSIDALYKAINDIPVITVDDALSDTSTNPVQNKVVKSALDSKLEVKKLTVTDNTLSRAQLAALDAGIYEVDLTPPETGIPALTVGVNELTSTGETGPKTIYCYSGTNTVKIKVERYYQEAGLRFSLRISSACFCMSYDPYLSGVFHVIELANDIISPSVPDKLTDFVTTDTLSNYQQKDYVKTNITTTSPALSLTASIQNSIYQYSNVLTSLTITVPATPINLDQSIRLIFKATSATTITVPSGLYFRGDDCNDSYVFIPQDNKVYDIIITYDGFNYNGIVVGTPATR